MTVGRLAPTPSGHLHLGNALAFGAAWLSVRNANGRLLLRIEDLDRGRARPDIAQSQRDDLRWLGLDWDTEVPTQSTRTYSLDGLDVYPCTCPRATRLSWGCRCRFVPPPAERAVWRLKLPEGERAVIDRARGTLSLPFGDDPIVQRQNGEAAYPLAVVVDDHRDGVTEVVRGADLLEATPAQVHLHGVLGLAVPTYLHVPVLLGPDGRKLSKSHGAAEIRALRATGVSPERIWARLLPLLGVEGPLRDAKLDPLRVQRGPITLATP